MIYVIGIGPGDPSYGLLGQEAYFEKADRILGSERHLEILPPAYRDKGLVPPKKLAALAELLESFGEDEEILYLASGDPLFTAWANGCQRSSRGAWSSRQVSAPCSIWPAELPCL